VLDNFRAQSILAADKYVDEPYKMKKEGGIIHYSYPVNLPGSDELLEFMITFEMNQINLSFHHSNEDTNIARYEHGLNGKIPTHRNPSGCSPPGLIVGNHKHRFNGRYRDDCAYIPTDIDTSSLEAIVRTFCEECGIKFASSLPPGRQIPLPQDLD
jgi:hypothetical protein